MPDDIADLAESQESVMITINVDNLAKYNGRLKDYFLRNKEILDGKKNIIIDLGKVESVNPAALGELLSLRMKYRESKIYLKDKRENIDKVLETTGMNDVFEDYTNYDK